MAPRVIVQIITYRTEGIEEELDELFASLVNVCAPEGGWLLAVIDQPSPLGDLRDYLEKNVKPRSGVDLPEVVFVFSDENAGFAGGHTKLYDAIRDRNPEFVYLLNQDAHVDPNVLTSIVHYAELHSNTAIIQSRIMRAQNPDQYNSAGNAMHFLGFGYSLKNGEVRITENPPPAVLFYASGAGVLIRSSILDGIGGMFEPLYFMYHDDVDICWRAQLAGFDIGFADESVVYHRYEFSRSMKKFFWMERNRHLTNLCNYRTRTLLVIAPAMIVMEFGTLLFAFRSGWWKEKLRSWAFFMQPSTWRYIRTRRALIRALRTRTDREMMEHMVGVITAQEVEHPIVTHIVNPVFSVYFGIVKRIIFW